MRFLEVLKRSYLLIWLAGIAAGLSAADPIREPLSSATPEPDFSGKVLAISIKGADGAGCTIEKVQVRRLGNRSFLVGSLVQSVITKPLGTERKDADGMTVWVAVDEINQIAEFKDIEEVRKFYKSKSVVPTNTDPSEPDEDVDVMDDRSFYIPIFPNPKAQDKIDKIRVFVSHDRGKSWSHHKDWNPGDTGVSFTAPRDGLYWFAVQSVFKDKTKDPPDEMDLVPGVKVFVNSERRPLKSAKSTPATRVMEKD